MSPDSHPPKKLFSIIIIIDLYEDVIVVEKLQIPIKQVHPDTTEKTIILW